MAYQTRQRDPLLDRETQAILERRGAELIGLGLLGAGIAMALMLVSYSPEDPSWLSATDATAQNLLGRIGASVASPLVVIAGLASWGIAAVLAVWGLRLLLHKGGERATTV
jgi:DNA segregation ATPase FtsK/SpoIIIE, S-DNA-T family